MTEHDPKQAIINDLCHPRTTFSWIGPAVSELLGTQMAFDYEEMGGTRRPKTPKN